MSLSQLLSALSSSEDSDSLQALIPAAVAELQALTFPSETFTISRVTELVTACSEWILKFSASKKLALVLHFEEELLKACGLEEGINFLVEKEDANGLEGVFSAAFASCLLSLLNSVLASAKLDKYSKILLTLLRLSSMTVPLSSISSALRRKGLLKQLVSLFTSTLKTGVESEAAKQLCRHLSTLLTKLAINHEKCRDYLIRKGGVQAAAAFLKSDFADTARLPVVLDLVYFLGGLAGSSKDYADDQQLLVWVSNGVQLAMKFYQRAVETPSSTTEAVRSAVLYFMWRLSINNVELQRVIKEQRVDEIAMASLKDSAVKLETVVFAVGVLRRLSSNNDYKAELSERVLEPVLTQLSTFSRSKFTLLLKESVACIGSISSDETVLNVLLERNFPELVLDIAVRNISALKLLKTCIGALVNISLTGEGQVERCMDRIASNTYFYQLAEGILERHSDSVYFLDYILRLLANALVNSTHYPETSLFHLSNEKTVSALERALRCFPSDENISRYAIRILRMLLSVEKGREVVIGVLRGREGEVIEELLNAFDAQVDKIDIVVEAVHLLADLLSLPASPYLPVVSSSSHFPKTMNGVLTQYRVLIT